MSFSSTRTVRRGIGAAAIVAVALFSTVGTAGAKGPPQSTDSGTSAGSATVVYGAGCFVNLSEDGSFTRTFGTHDVTFVLSSPYHMSLCVEPSDAGGFTDSGSFTLSTPAGTLTATVSGTETVTAFSFILTATSGTGLYQGVTGTIAWNGTRTVTGPSTMTTSGVWTANLDRPVL